jgi:hypothetical protein
MAAAPEKVFRNMYHFQHYVNEKQQGIFARAPIGRRSLAMLGMTVFML